MTTGSAIVHRPIEQQQGVRHGECYVQWTAKRPAYDTNRSTQGQ